MTEYYQSSKGPVLITEMEFPHLKNSIAKLEREGPEPDKLDQLDAMRAELTRREAIFADQRAKMEAHGVTVRLATQGVGFTAVEKDGREIGTAKTEDGAWAKAWAELKLLLG